MTAQSTKILNILQKSSATERLDFTNSILNFANKQERKYVDSLLPALSYLADDTQDVKKALLNQFIPLIQMVLDNFGDDCYLKVCNTVFPLIEKLLYDKSDEIRDRAISIVAEIRNEVKENEKEHVMRLTLGLAHDENEKLRESAVKLLNELAPDMG